MLVTVLSSRQINNHYNYKVLDNQGNSHIIKGLSDKLQLNKQYNLDINSKQTKPEPRQINLITNLSIEDQAQIKDFGRTSKVVRQHIENIRPTNIQHELYLLNQVHMRNQENLKHDREFQNIITEIKADILKKQPEEIILNYNSNTEDLQIKFDNFNLSSYIVDTEQYEAIRNVIKNILY